LSHHEAAPRRQDQNGKRLSHSPRRGQNIEPVAVGETQIKDRGVIIDELQHRNAVPGRVGDIDRNLAAFQVCTREPDLCVYW